MLAPIAIFTYNRISHTKRLVDSLSQNELANQSEVFVFSDGFKNEQGKETVLQLRQYLYELKATHSFASYTVVESSENLGLAKSIIQGVTDIIQKYGKVIVLEDDLILSTGFLLFMNQALDYYQDDEKIWSISGTSRTFSKLSTCETDVYFSPRSSSWGWATWKNRWEIIDWAVSDYNEFKCSWRQRRAFNRGGSDMSNMLDQQMLGLVNSWAIRWCYAQFKQGAYTVIPKQTLVSNGGQDGSGTHCNKLIEKSNLSTKSQWEFCPYYYSKSLEENAAKLRNKVLLKRFVAYIWLVLLRQYTSNVAKHAR